jgi:hypothetical protein
LLIKRKHFTAILFLVLAFPAAALAAGTGGSTASPSVGPAQVVPITPLQRPVERFQRLVRTIAHDIRADERAAARKQEREREEEFAELPGGVSLSTLESIASCESGGDPAAVSSDGTYRGKYQFDYGTWESMGGSGDPAAAPEADQDRLAAKLLAAQGTAPWPACARKVGAS